MTTPLTALLSTALLLLGALLAISGARAGAGFVVQSVDREERVPWSRGGLATIAREAATQTLFVLLRPVSAWSASLPEPSGGPPVLLVPSPTWSRATTMFLDVFLTHRGFRAWPMRFAAPRASIAEQAEEVEAAIRTLCGATRSEQVDVVAHGLGGLAVAWALRHGDAAPRVRRLVTLGTPWAGTRMAVFLPGPVAQEALPLAHHLDGLSPPSVPTSCVWCPEDPLIIPATSAVADGAVHVAVSHTGHLGLLLSARAMHAVHTSLSDALPEVAS